MNKKESSGFIDIIKNVTILNTDGNQEHFDAICITENGVHIGLIKDNKFVPFGFIPHHSIIELCNNDGEKIKEKRFQRKASND